MHASTVRLHTTLGVAQVHGGLAARRDAPRRESGVQRMPRPRDLLLLLAVALTGAMTAHWKGGPREVDFFDAKGVVVATTTLELFSNCTVTPEMPVSSEDRAPLESKSRQTVPNKILLMLLNLILRKIQKAKEVWKWQTN